MIRSSPLQGQELGKVDDVRDAARLSERDIRGCRRDVVEEDPHEPLTGRQTSGAARRQRRLDLLRWQVEQRCADEQLSHAEHGGFSPVASGRRLSDTGRGSCRDAPSSRHITLRRRVIGMVRFRRGRAWQGRGGGDRCKQESSYVSPYETPHGLASAKGKSRTGTQTTDRAETGNETEEETEADRHDLTAQCLLRLLLQPRIIL